jgi:hypothetical protein
VAAPEEQVQHTEEDTDESAQDEEDNRWEVITEHYWAL